ncbi:glutamine synthetase, type I [Actinomyces urogenitalis DSM 15434]|uniref:Glutamine synthetase n=1 Tax=Actinomyces urogenitalis DSM 15434 TaxID=525246 RepID=C0W3V3_9ACTO|nr:type I glutamate--ammonia ligase [Actinomyces urogenitalis]EEH66567.1 glutamine synthetase, type I [Actinomyces urogenitalis DSM 15434]KGF02134.1 glutamine synthetase [Actinomyces urogenitalis S6-C4]MBS6071406.1 type I glutamate--ammonia ligase [Actinomyces urogenitalis]MDK8835419.1 type I glutamate--ammonia ligase [Actinomyces urogenitalis]MDU0865095.1 type I glutamate--ammonia ligase [Actinomyces urogenitalis]
MFKDAAEALAYIDKEEVVLIDVRFCDLPGVMQHFTIPAKEFKAEALVSGLMFDGSSIRGFTAIHESDMKLVPDVTTAFLDPFREQKTLVINFSIVDPFTDEVFSRDPRSVAAKAENYLRSTGIADTCYIGAEAEFYLFDSIEYETTPASTRYAIDSAEAAWNSGRSEEGGNKGYKTPFKGGYFPVSPNDQMADIRDAMVRTCQEVGLDIERAHHEVGTAGQQEINYRFASLLAAGDDMMKFKYVIKNEAWRQGKTATFMPKPVFGDNGSGMHCHHSLWKDGEPLFFDERGYGQLSDLARWYIGGILKHAPSLLAFTNPSVNSFRRLVPGFEAPVNLVYSARNRSACIRIPVTGSSPKAKRVEYRVPDPSANPYLAFAAVLMAGIDGIRGRIEPREPIDKDLYDLAPEEYFDIDKLPYSLDQALDALEADHDYLTEGDVFTPDLIQTWIDYKREHEIAPLRQRPHPYEFELYYNL